MEFQFEQICNFLHYYPFVLVPISYVIYRLTRTSIAILQAVLLYWVIPLFYKPNFKKFANRWTVVTGATDGIGKAYTIELAKRGCKRFLLIGRNQQKLDAIQAEIEKRFTNLKVRTFLFDFESDDFAKIRTELALMDIGLAVNSVGVGRQYLERFGDRPDTDAQILRVNGIGAAEFLLAVLPAMERSGGGQIVNLSSSQGVRPIPLLAAYSASKSMLSFLSEAIDREYSTISVQCLTPALVATNMTYYKSASLFVVTPESFARQAVNALGVVHRTSGCFNHEIQMLILHLLPWTILKLLITPIYWIQQRRMISLHGPIDYKKSEDQNTSLDSNIADQSQPTGSPRCSRIPTSNGTVRNRA